MKNAWEGKTLSKDEFSCYNTELSITQDYRGRNDH